MKTINKLLLAGGILIAVKGLDNRLEVTHYKIKSRKIPKEFSGFKIIQVSDYHCEFMPGLAQEVALEKPDIIVSTGDMVNDEGNYEPAVSLVERLTDIAPTYMVTGNHDIWRSDRKEIENACKDAGGIFLHNESAELERDGARIALTGIDDPFTRVSEKMVAHINDAIDSMSHYDGFNILLFHRANLLDEFKNRGFDLILAGHMHGGQMRLPVIGGVISPRTSMASKCRMIFPRYFGGIYKAGDTKMIVNRGIGNPMIVPRIFNRPELVSITLEHKSDTDVDIDKKQ